MAIEDVLGLSEKERTANLDLIDLRFGGKPASYGKALGVPLKGLRRLRIGSYRIAYEILKDVVLVWAIRHRKDVYEILEDRYHPGA